MSSAGKAASRYSSFDSQSSTSSSADLKHKPSLKHVVSNSNSRKINGAVISNTSRAKSNEIVKVKAQNEQNFGAMVKKFIEHRSNLKAAAKDRALPLIVPADFIAEDLKKTGAKSKGSKLAALPRKLFGKGSAEKETKTKALTEVRANTRTLAMVLRSERELLSFNKDQEADIAHLKSLLEERNHEVEKLKDLCLKQREEIKALKSAILFPDEMNSQLQELLERQGSELKQARQVIPTLQRQITSLTGQLRCLSDDLAEVKADKYPRKPSFDDDVCSPQAEYDQEEAANSLDFSAGDPMTPDSPDDMLLKDMNPCLTPCYSKIKSKEYETCSESPGDERFCATNFRGRKLSISSDCGAKHHV